jgi:DNA polymerase III delta subunit
LIWSKSNDQVSIIISVTPLNSNRKDLQDLKPLAQQFIIHTFAAAKPWEKRSEKDVMQINRVEALFKKLGIKYESTVPEILIARVGESTRVVLNEVEKLAIYVE